MPFGAGPSPGGLEAATEVWMEESKQLSATLVPPQSTNSIAWPNFYDLGSFDHCKPVLQDAFRRLPIDPTQPFQLLDYVDDYAITGDSVAQVDWHSALAEGAAGYRGFRFPVAKKYQSWDTDSDNKLLGYHLRNDLLSPVFSAELLPENSCSPVTKRAVSHTLASLYDPLGRYIEYSMKGRSLWRSVVDSTREDEVPTALTWNKAVPNGLVKEVNRWAKAVSALPPTPRFIPVRWRCPTSSSYHHCQLLVSCDASNIGWCVDVRSKVNGLPIGPRLCGRGGLFPQRRSYHLDGKSTSTPTSTVPRLELHSLLQAAKELLRLCSAVRLSPANNTTAIIMSDSLINIQRLCRMSDKSETELMSCIGKKGKCNYSRSDLGKLLKIRQTLREVPIPVTLIHLPSALNLADDGSRCRVPSRGSEEMELLEAVLQDPTRRPNYVPGKTNSDDSRSDADDVAYDYIKADEPGSAALCATAPQAGPLPTPFNDSLGLPILSESDRATIDDAIDDSIKNDGFYSAVRSYLKDGTVADGHSPARLKRQATNFELDANGRLFRIVRQRPDATVVRQRVISGHAHNIIDKIIITRHLEWHHLGPQKLAIRLSDSFYWPRQRRTVARALRSVYLV
ncbi:hypothetical protein Pmar_PMAR003225 [Perkinsus marinus ATCC 50983]|uniref:Integrase zinc-binding domain-containing protein n=1 Tax=Perkinsus marinus (strain ATCC 50983 / TXsc) TaxID=423536 RepID=C5LKI5_PERM5|nr:hypothetical protein Pmar_PMAR003225 [Perkinsus marinus ATCC 50983]EER02752.1 hypothetical protein Pmar_PMAR003225 [Perkinsus marinus ATCC 50983]|eukprot:XP_002770936.1 hypothetical protein Pmar_PMAR003225 [Perkinsus marinus ATCC 50983]